MNAIVNDPVNDSGASNLGCRSPQNEAAIAVNPSNPNHLLAGANDYRTCCNSQGIHDATGWVYVSLDGGTTWTNVQVPGLTVQTGGVGVFKQFDAAGDPAIAISPDGVSYYANIVFNRQSPASGIAVGVSHDGGLTWSAPNMVAYMNSANFFNDKELIAAGPNGKVVVTWTRFDKTGSPIVMAFSDNYGQSWVRSGSPVSDPAHPFNQGSFPQFGPDGTLYVAYEGASPTTGYTTDATVIARSTDDGQPSPMLRSAGSSTILTASPSSMGGRRSATSTGGSTASRRLAWIRSPGTSLSCGRTTRAWAPVATVGPASRVPRRRR